MIYHACEVMSKLQSGEVNKAKLKRPSLRLIAQTVWLLAQFQVMVLNFIMFGSGFTRYFIGNFKVTIKMFMTYYIYCFSSGLDGVQGCLSVLEGSH